MARAKFTPVPGLDEKVAWMVAPEVRKIAQQVERTARRLAPPTKTWVSMGDLAVRDTHRQAHGQEVPENLRFEVPGTDWDVAHGLSPGIDYMLEPKDTSSGLPADAVQIVHCRCVAALNPLAIADKITTGPAQVYGAQVRVVVSCTAFKIVECEFGDTTPTGIPMPGTHFMRRAAARVAGRGGVARGYETGGTSIGRSDGGMGDE